MEVLGLCVVDEWWFVDVGGVVCLFFDESGCGLSFRVYWLIRVCVYSVWWLYIVFFGDGILMGFVFLWYRFWNSSIGKLLINSYSWDFVF